MLAVLLHKVGSWAGYKIIMTISAGLSFSLIFYRATVLWRLLRRVRWLLFFLILIFAFNTPGEYISQWPFDPGQTVSPTYEGLFAGLLQSAKLCIMLAGLSLLLATTNREGLIAGFYLLASPLRIIKLNPERFAARLWLTLHYVEQAPKINLKKNITQSSFWDRFSELTMYKIPADNTFEPIQLSLPDLTWRDLLVLAVLIGCGIYLLCA